MARDCMSGATTRRNGGSQQHGNREALRAIHDGDGTMTGSRLGAVSHGRGTMARIAMAAKVAGWVAISIIVYIHININ